MRVLVAPDSFAGTLSAAEAALAIEEGWRLTSPDDVVERLPLSDGGPGFVDVLATALPDAERLPVTVEDALARPVRAELLLHGTTAYVESAQACGLHLLTEQEREVSYRRRLLHGKIDILRAELVNRLRAKREDGESVISGADVQQLTDILLGKVPDPDEEREAG